MDLSKPLSKPFIAVSLGTFVQEKVVYPSSLRTSAIVVSFSLSSLLGWYSKCSFVYFPVNTPAIEESVHSD